jgi:hypothetical protein
MDKRFVLSVVVMFLLLTALGYLVHGVLLAPDYAALPSIYRSAEEQMRHFAWIPLANLVSAFVFVWIYRRGREDKPPVAQGFRYGLAIAALVSVPRFLIYYSTQPIPGSLPVRQILFDSTMFILMGIAVALLNKTASAGDRPAPARRP